MMVGSHNANANPCIYRPSVPRPPPCECTRVHHMSHHTFLSENDIRFQHLKEFKNEIPDLRRQRERSWISKLTWNLIDKRVRAIRWCVSQQLIQDYGKEIRKSLRRDHRQ